MDRHTPYTKASWSMHIDTMRVLAAGVWAASIAVALGCVNPDWTEILDVAAKKAILHPTACNEKGDIAYFLNGKAPEIGPGWTVYINPYDWNCTAGATCAWDTIPSLATVQTGSTLVDFVVTPILIPHSNITISSRFDSVPVNFQTSMNTAKLVQGRVPQLAVFRFQGSGVSLYNMHFTADLNDMALFVDPDSVYDHTAVIHRTSDASHSHYANLTATQYSAVLMVLPQKRYTSVDVSGLTVDASVVLDNAHATSTFTMTFPVVAWWCHGVNLTVTTTNMLISTVGNFSGAAITASEVLNATAWGALYHPGEGTIIVSEHISTGHLATGLVVAVVILSILMCMTCTYTCLRLKRRYRQRKLQHEHAGDSGIHYTQSDWRHRNGSVGRRPGRVKDAKSRT